MNFRIYYTLFLLCISLIAQTQAKYFPTIVVLDPYKASFDSSLSKEIAEFIYQDIYTPKEEKDILDSLKKQAKNIASMDIAEFHYRKKMDYGSNFSLGLFGMITYIIFGQTEDGLILPSHDKSDGSVSDLQKIAKKYKVEWVINPVYLKSYFLSPGKKISKVRIQVYHTKTNKLIHDAEYEGDTSSPGFELSCEEGTLECTFSNILDVSLNKIMESIYNSK